MFWLSRNTFGGESLVAVVIVATGRAYRLHAARFPAVNLISHAGRGSNSFPMTGYTEAIPTSRGEA
jgi:hypothetical protein